MVMERGVGLLHKLWAGLTNWLAGWLGCGVEVWFGCGCQEGLMGRVVVYRCGLVVGVWECGDEVFVPVSGDLVLLVVSKLPTWLLCEGNRYWEEGGGGAQGRWCTHSLTNSLLLIIQHVLMNREGALSLI